MIDITLMIMGKQSNHSLPPEKEPGRWLTGQIVNVYKSENIATLTDGDYHINGGIGSKAHVFVHIKNVPGNAAKKIRNILANQVRTEPVDPEEHPELIHRSAWRIKPSDLPAGIKQKLQDDKEVTVGWVAAKPYLKNSVTQTPITDGDLA